MNIAIIGNGEFGKALASLLDFNHIDYDFITEATNSNKKIDLAFFAVPAQAFRIALKENQPNIDNGTILVNCSKGIEENSHLLPHQIAKELGNYPHYFTLAGPSFAKEIVQQNPTSISLGYKKSDKINLITDILSTPYFDIYPSADLESLELASALKNVYAILCGYAYGLGFGVNTRVKLILDAIKELESLANALGYSIGNIEMPGITGDIILTCMSEQSRNYNYGANLAQQHTPNSREHKKTIEGYYTCHSINELAKQHNIELPAAQLTARLANGTFIAADEFRHILSNRLS